MVCPICGATNPAESAFCGGCGSVLAPVPDVVVDVAAPASSGQVPPAPASPSESLIPVQSEVIAPQDQPTMRAGAAPVVPPAPLTPQPEPAAGEVFNFGAPAPQETPDQSMGPQVSATPVLPNPIYQAPTQLPGYPGQVSGTYPLQTPLPGQPGGVYPGQQQVPGYPSGVYPGQQQVPDQSGAMYPGQQQVSGQLGGVYPGQQVPGYPGGVYPGQQQVPGQPGGVYSGQQPAPGYSSGAYPGQVSGAEYPAGAYPGSVSGASYPGFPASGAFYPGFPGGIPVQPAAYKAPSKLINPLPGWAFISSIIVIVLVLLALVFFTGSDWAAGAQTAGVIAMVLGVLLLVVFGMRAALGLLAQTNAHRRSQILSSLLLAFLLFAFGAIGLTQQLGIHTAQAHVLEGQSKWQTSIDEYKLGGQGEPASTDIARVYNEWGKQLLNQGQTEAALGNFTTVITQYNQSGDEETQAEKNAVSAYLDWGNQALQNKQYDAATKHFDDLLNQLYCDTNCKNQASAADATAYYNLAEQQLGTENYTAAVAAFNQLTTHFGNSAKAQSAHADYAKALWGLGQQQLTTACSTAVTTYKQLSTQFSDTTQGQQATAELKKPQGVKGIFTSTIPSGDNVPTVGLAQGISAGMSTDAFYAILDKSPLALVNSDGSFTFKPVAQGTYYLVWGVLTSSVEDFYVTQQYPATVGPLCTFDFGNINEAFPSP